MALPDNQDDQGRRFPHLGTAAVLSACHTGAKSVAIGMPESWWPRPRPRPARPAYARIRTQRACHPCHVVPCRQAVGVSLHLSQDRTPLERAGRADLPRAVRGPHRR
jgi:hypothetical protein